MSRRFPDRAHLFQHEFRLALDGCVDHLTWDGVERRESRDIHGVAVRVTTDVGAFHFSRFVERGSTRMISRCMVLRAQFISSSVAAQSHLTQERHSFLRSETLGHAMQEIGASLRLARRPAGDDGSNGTDIGGQSLGDLLDERRLERRAVRSRVADLARARCAGVGTASRL